MEVIMKENTHIQASDTAERFNTSANQNSGGFDAFIALFAGFAPGGTTGNAQNGRKDH
jgi:hypothetical protein